ncbi:MAG TPA: hypothetical protein IAB45_02860 [Candidatus Onthousia faecavium]|nr:hypothetical protein [Candidatus Onthousia faecavium]
MKIDTDRIKSLTSQMIGYENFKKEKIIKKMKMKKVLYVFLGALTLSMGTLSVDALTDNAISNTFKEIFSLNFNVDGEEKNASCIKNENGIITCTIEGDETTFDIKTSASIE